jgi:hypothetical protein
MSAILKQKEEFTIFDSMACHQAWYGQIPGINADLMLRGKAPYTYMLREGEPSSHKNERHFYVTYVGPDSAIRHQPLVIEMRKGAWNFTNGRPGGPFNFSSIDPVLHLIMHCQEGECIPFVTK